MERLCGKNVQKLVEILDLDFGFARLRCSLCQCYGRNLQRGQKE